jgi:hypothetical protein
MFSSYAFASMTLLSLSSDCVLHTLCESAKNQPEIAMVCEHGPGNKKYRLTKRRHRPKGLLSETLHGKLSPQCATACQRVSQRRSGPHSRTGRNRAPHFLPTPTTPLSLQTRSKRRCLGVCGGGTTCLHLFGASCRLFAGSGFAIFRGFA